MKAKIILLMLFVMMFSFISANSFAYDYLIHTHTSTGTTDMSNYYTKAEEDATNSSNNNYILYVNSTNGAGGGTSYTPPFTEWINYSFSNQSSTSSTVMTPITDLNVSLIANNLYSFDCMIGFNSNITTNGMKTGMAGYPAPALIWYTAKIDQAADGTDAFFEGSGTTAFDNITSTAVAAAGTNYTARITGNIRHSANVYVNPYFLSENNTRTTFSTTKWCRWTKIN